MQRQCADKGFVGGLPARICVRICARIYVLDFPVHLRRGDLGIDSSRAGVGDRFLRCRAGSDFV